MFALMYNVHAVVCITVLLDGLEDLSAVGYRLVGG